MTAVGIDGDTPLPENQSKEDAFQSDIIRLRCKKCGRKLRVKSTRAGQRIDCPKCENKIFVPRPCDRQSPREQSSVRKQGAPESDISFTALAKQLDVQSKKASGDAGAEDAADRQKPPAKKKLSNRKYRQFTKVLEHKGLLPTEKLRQRADVLRELGQSGDSRAYDWLIADVEHNELQIRQAAVVGLGELADPRCLPLLVSLLDDDSLVLRKAALLALGKIQDRRSIKPLLLFGLKDPQMKFLASEAVAGMGESAVQPLIELLDDQELGIVLEAIVLLGHIKDPRARRALMMVIDARQPLLQCHAIEALGQIGDPKSIGPLSRLLASPDANVRVTAAAALSKMASDKNVVAPLVKALNDSDEDVVTQAALGLGESGAKRAAEPLSRLLRSPHEKVRLAAALAMGELGDRRAIPDLLALLDGDAPEIQLKVLSTLRKMKPPHISGELLKRLGHPKATVRRRIVDALAPIGDAEAAEKLEHVLRADPADEVRMAAARALGEIADPASVDCLKDALHNDEFSVRCQVIGALGAIGDEECYNTLMTLLEDQLSEVRFHAAVALGEVGNTNAVPALKDLLKDKNAMVVRGATKALEKLGVADAESHAKRAQRSKRMEALAGVVDTIKSYLPDTPHAQKMVYGGALAALVLVLGLAWLGIKLFQGPPERVIVRGNVQTLSFLPDNTTVVVGRTMGLVEIWDADSAKLKDQQTPPGGSRLVATPNPETLAIISGTAVQLWNIGGNDELPPAAGHATPITQSVVSPDRTVMGTLATDGGAIVWDLKTGQPRGRVRLPSTEVKGFTMSADGTLLAGGNEKGGVTIWKSHSGEVVRQFAGSSAVSGTAFSPDGKQLAVSFVDSLIVWSLESGEQVGTSADGKNLSLLQYAPSGKTLAGARGVDLLVWDAGTLGQPKTLSVDKAETLGAMAFSPDGTKVAVGGEDSAAVWVFDAATGALQNTLNDRSSGRSF